MIQKILSLFKKEKVVKEVTTVEPIIDNLFGCPHCGHRFEVTAKMQFPTSVPKIGAEGYFYQGIGVLCPLCHKTLIYG
jgi:hypothetical protein